MNAFKLPDAARIKFLDRLLDEVKVLKNQNGPFDLENIRRLGHQLKGSAATFGFSVLGDIGAQLEDEAKAGNQSHIPDFIAQLESNATKFHSEFSTSSL